MTGSRRPRRLGPYTVRIIAKAPNPVDLQTIAYQFYIFDSKVLDKLDNKADYGRTAIIGTGPFKVVSLAQNKMVLDRFDGWWGDIKGPLGAHVKHIVAMPIPDRQTADRAIPHRQYRRHPQRQRRHGARALEDAGRARHAAA